MKKSAISWRSIVLLLLVPVFFYSCTASRPVIETGVQPGIDAGAEPGGEAGEQSAIEGGAAVEAVDETEVEPGVDVEVASGVEAEVTPPVEPTSGLRVIGEVEPVTLMTPGITMPARIDTGATTSSLDASDIKRFERDGKKWVRFMVTDRRSGEKKQMECPLSRSVKIKRHGEESLERPVVKVKAMMGDVELVREFSLTDRSEFEYQILIGRNVLEGEFVVDVNRKNVTSPMSEK
ncbi:ATP-dependent zinc protease [Desulfoluna limicola]|nr:RimK/LysX family protein [Desulfoluna limicola]